METITELNIVFLIYYFLFIYVRYEEKTAYAPDPLRGGFKPTLCNTRTRSITATTSEESLFPFLRL